MSSSTSMSNVSSTPSEQDLLAFGEALTTLANSETSTLAKFYEIFKGTAQQMKGSEVTLNAEEKKLFDEIFGMKDPVYPSIPFRIPYLPFQQIMANLNPYDILNFAITSNASKDLVKYANLKVDKLRLVLGDPDYAKFVIEAPNQKKLDFRVQVKDLFRFPFEKVKDIKFVGCEIVTKVREDREDVRSWSADVLDVHWNCKDRDEMTKVSKVLLNIVMSLFKPSHFSLLEKSIERTIRFMRDFTNRFDYFNFSSDYKRGPLTDEEFRVLMEDMEVDDFYISVPVTSYSGTLRHPEIRLHCGEWVRIHNIINMECQDLSVRDSTLTAAELNLFIRNWMEGGLPNLKRCYFGWKERCSIYPKDWPNITRGIETVQWHPPLKEFQSTCRTSQNWCVENVNGERAILTSGMLSFQFRLLSEW